MSLRFPYQLFRTRSPLWSLQGRSQRPRPVVPITLIGPAASATRDSLLDTGADDSVFPETLAAILGVDLSAAPAGLGAGAGMTVLALRFAEVILRIAGPQEQREWKARVGFTPAKLRQPILGFAGFLQFFTATFHGDREDVELTINPTYPGT